ncbi:MAG: alpha/beta fold hydrolase [bacterium]
MESDSIHDTFGPRAEQIYVPPISKDLQSFLEKIWYAFVNKVVSLRFLDDRFVFNHSVFEAIQGDQLKITVSSSKYAMRELVDSDEPPRQFKAFVARTKPIPLDDERNYSATLIRRAIIEVAQGQPPPIEELDLQRDAPCLHPKLINLLTPAMKLAWLVPLFVRQTPIGVLWGIRNGPITGPQRRQVDWKLRNLFEGISNIITYELDHDRDYYTGRRSIEKIEENSRINHILHRRQAPELPPVKSLYAYSHRFRREYRLDTSYLVPSSGGHSISIKQYLPRDSNRAPVNLLMIPGFFCNRSAMDRLAMEMALKYRYKVLSLDVRGRSRFTAPSDKRNLAWTVDDYIHHDFPTALTWIRERFPGERTVVFGHSMGGMIPMFYAGSYHTIGRLYGRTGLPDPNERVAGIVSLSSPSHIDLQPDLVLVDLIRKGANLLPRRLASRALTKVLSQTIPLSFRTIDLNRFFTLLAKVSKTLRALSFNLGTRLPTIKDFVGYEQITPPEWYFLMEDVFCEESSKVVFQFVRSQLGERSFFSFDEAINYTEELRNVRVPIYAFLGSKDTLAPPRVIQHGLDRMTRAPILTTTYGQGHLGIIMHLPTVKRICARAHEWIQTL